MDHRKLWDGRRWYALDAYLKNTFGEKVYKITLNERIDAKRPGYREPKPP